MRHLVVLTILSGFFAALAAPLSAGPKENFNNHIRENIPVYYYNSAGSEIAYIKTHTFVRAKGSIRAKGNLKKQGGKFEYLGTVPLNTSISINYAKAAPRNNNSIGNTPHESDMTGLGQLTEHAFDDFRNQGESTNRGTILMSARHYANQAFKKRCCDDKEDRFYNMNIGYKMINIKANRKGASGIRYTPAKALFIEIYKKPAPAAQPHPDIIYINDLR